MQLRYEPQHQRQLLCRTETGIGTLFGCPADEPAAPSVKGVNMAWSLPQEIGPLA